MKSKAFSLLVAPQRNFISTKFFFNISPNFNSIAFLICILIYFWALWETVIGIIYRKPQVKCNLSGFLTSFFIFSWFISIVAYVDNVFYYFQWLNISRKFHSLLIHSSTDRHLEWLQFGVIMSQAVMNICVQLVLKICFHILVYLWKRHRCSPFSFI